MWGVFRVIGACDRQKRPLHPAVERGCSIIRRGFVEKIDMGAVACSDGKVKFPREQYRLDAEHAHAEAYELWQSSRPEQISFEAKFTLRAFQQSGLPYLVRTLGPDEFPRAVARLPRETGTGISLPNSDEYWHRALRHTEAMADLLRGQNPIFHPHMTDGTSVLTCATILIRNRWPTASPATSSNLQPSRSQPRLPRSPTGSRRR